MKVVFWGHSKRPTMLNGGTAEDRQFKGPIFIYSSSQSVKTISISKERIGHGYGLPQLPIFRVPGMYTTKAG